MDKVSQTLGTECHHFATPAYRSPQNGCPTCGASLLEVVRSSIALIPIGMKKVGLTPDWIKQLPEVARTNPSLLRELRDAVLHAQLMATREALRGARGRKLTRDRARCFAKTKRAAWALLHLLSGPEWQARIESQYEPLPGWFKSIDELRQWVAKLDELTFWLGLARPPAKRGAPGLLSKRFLRQDVYFAFEAAGLRPRGSSAAQALSACYEAAFGEELLHESALSDLAGVSRWLKGIPKPKRQRRPRQSEPAGRT